MNRRLRATARLGNRFTLISDGQGYFGRMLSAIDDSRDYVLAEFYLVESGAIMNKFIAAFARASARGVRVRLVFDAFGARGLVGSDRARLRDSGVNLIFYNEPRWRSFSSIFLRDHRKVLIVDGVIGFTGGAGLADVFSPVATPEAYWLDCMLEIAGPVLDDWHALFARTWRNCAHRPLDVAARRAMPVHPGETGRVVASAGLGRKELGRSVIKRVRAAKSRVWIATAYFWPSASLRRALRRAARRGVDVRLILTGPHTDAPIVRGVGRLFYARLITNHVVIHEYQQGFLHCKAILCDDWASIGSSNLDRWGALWNLDANQEIHSPIFAQQLEATISRICKYSRVLRYPSDVEHSWTVYLWRLLARAVFAWSARAISRMRR